MIPKLPCGDSYCSNHHYFDQIIRIIVLKFLFHAVNLSYFKHFEMYDYNLVGENEKHVHVLCYTYLQFQTYFRRQWYKNIKDILSE